VGDDAEIVDGVSEKREAGVNPVAGHLAVHDARSRSMALRWGVRPPVSRSAALHCEVDHDLADLHGNTPANQAYNEFNSCAAFAKDARARIDPETIRKRGQTPKNASVFVIGSVQSLSHI
tara:strand:+ start:281 stop:640 length:360 start_codon:yes stop_codon:yes gene_type:complete